MINLKYKFINDLFLGQKAMRPIDLPDDKKDKMVRLYMSYFPLDNALADIREQIDEESLICFYINPEPLKNIVYSAVEQKLNDLVDEYNAQIFQDDHYAAQFNPNRAMEDAGHKQSDFM